MCPPYDTETYAASLVYDVAASNHKMTQHFSSLEKSWRPACVPIAPTNVLTHCGQVTPNGVTDTN